MKKYNSGQNEKHPNCPNDEELKQILEEVANATVELGNGQGVLVHGQVFITAGHCVKVANNASMAFHNAQGPTFIEEIRTSSGRILQGWTIAVEPVNDVAAVGALDPNDAPDQYEAFTKFCAETKPVKVCRGKLMLVESFPIHLRTHFKGWIKGRATLCGPGNPLLRLDLDEPIIPGTSGGPVVNNAGELVGVVVHTLGKAEQLLPSTIPRPHLALPVWVCRKIFSDDPN